jgi:hypothetical protein
MVVLPPWERILTRGVLRIIAVLRKAGRAYLRTWHFAAAFGAGPIDRGALQTFAKVRVWANRIG